MVRKLRFLMLLLPTLVLTASCTRKTEESSRITIRLPAASSYLKTAQNVSALSTKWQLADPATSAEINCYAVAVEAADFAGSANRCSTEADATVFSPHFIAGAFPAGSTQTLDVPAGSKRKIYLIGFHTDDTTECSSFANSVTGLDTNHFSAPYVLTHTLVDLAPGNVEVYLNVPSALDASMKFEECSPLAFARTTATTPLVLSAISPSLGAIAGGTTVTLIGSGFLGVSSVTLGGANCTSLVATASTLTCTTPAAGAGAVDVVVTRGLQTATLAGAFTFATLPTISVADVSLAESGGSALVTVSLAGTQLGAVTFDYATSSGTATSGTDFTTLSSSGTIGIGTTLVTVSVAIADDTLFENTEDFNFTLSNLSANAAFADSSATITITDNDTAPAVEFSAASQSVGENAGAITIAVSQPASGLTSTVDYAVTGGTASGGGVDFTLAAGTLTFNPGDTTKNISLTVVDDGALEGAETVIVTLSSPSSATLGGTVNHTVTINDNETPAVLGITDADPLDFGIKAIGSNNTALLTVANTGGVASSGMSGSGLAGSFGFSGGSYPGTSGTCGVTLNAGSNCTIQVVYAPGGSGTHNGTLQLDYNDGASPQTTTFGLQGEGANPAVLSITDGPTYSFGSITVGSTAEHLFTVTNTGGVAALSLSGLGLAAPYAYKGGSYPGTGGSCGTSLGAGASCDVVLTFSPAGFTAYNNTLSIDYNDGVSVQTASRDVSGSGVLTPVVTDAYAANGNLWLSWVKNDGPTKYEASNTACVGTETNFSLCLHAGEMRKVDLTGLANCTNITAYDSLGVFDWSCHMVGGSPYLFSQLKSGKGLRDLVSASSWYSNSVTVSLSGSPIGSSASTEWWSDAVIPLPATGATTAMTLNPVSATIYVAAANMNVHGYFIDVDQVGVVTLANQKLIWNNDSTDSCNALTGDLTATLNARCMIFGTGRKYLWIETTLDGEGGAWDAESGLIFFNSSFLKVHNSTVGNFTGSEMGVFLSGVTSSTLTGLAVNGAGKPVYLNASDGNLFHSFNLARGTQASTALLDLTGGSDNNHFAEGFITNHTNGNGIQLSNATNNVFQQLRVSNVAGGAGYGNLIKLSGATATNNKFVSVLGSSCDDAAVNLTNVTAANANNVFSHMTLANCTYNSVYIDNSRDNGFVQIASVNTGKAIQLYNAGSMGNLFDTLVLSDSGSFQFEIPSGVTAAISGLFLTNTNVCGGTGTGIDSACDSEAPSSFTKVNIATPGFVGAAVGDSANVSHSVGVINGPITAATDLFNFENVFRVMGMYSASPFPDSSFLGADPDGPIQIFDFSLANADTVLLNRSGDGLNANPTFTNGAPCPAPVDSDTTYVTMFGETFLRNATEILDEVGDNDGLCESNERCLYSPNFGFYQGSGDWTSNNCNFSSGSVGVGVDSVMMYALPTNGE